MTELFADLMIEAALLVSLSGALGIEADIAKTTTQVSFGPTTDMSSVT